MKLAMSVALFLVGCSTQPVQAPTGPVSTYKMARYDESCISLAKYARAVSIMRDLGANIDKIEDTLPVSPNVPEGTVKRYIYNRDEHDPVTTERTIFEECNRMGYDSLVSRFRIEELAYNYEEKHRETTKK